MATIKSYSDLQQSKKLAEILSIESADMCYVIDYVESNKYGTDHFKLEVDTYGLKVRTRDNIPCWSLAALLSVLDFPSLTQNKEDEWEVCVFDHDNDGYIEKTASNPVDACYELILKLHELNLL